MIAKTHYRKAFDSPYLSSADIIEATQLTISHVTLQLDLTKRTKENFNTAHFAEKELRPGEKLKPMILNANNSKVMRTLADSFFIEDWKNIRVTIYVEPNVRFGRETVEGLRISPNKPERKVLIPDNKPRWEQAKAAYKRDKNLDSVLKHVDISDDHQVQLKQECQNETS